MLKFRIDEILTEQERSAFWLAQKLDMDYHNVKKMVDGNTQMVKLSTLDGLCKILHVSLDELFKSVNE